MQKLSRNAREGVPYGLPRAADDDRQKGGCNGKEIGQPKEADRLFKV